MHPVAAVYLDDAGLVTIGVGVHAGATERLGPVSGESLHMLGVEAVAERMADHVVGHHPTMPGAGKTEHAVHSTRGLEDRLHPCIMTIVLRLCKTSKTESLDEELCAPILRRLRLLPHPPLRRLQVSRYRKPPHHPRPRCSALFRSTLGRCQHRANCCLRRRGLSRAFRGNRFYGHCRGAWHLVRSCVETGHDCPDSAVATSYVVHKPLHRTVEAPRPRYGDTELLWL